MRRVKIHGESIKSGKEFQQLQLLGYAKEFSWAPEKIQKLFTFAFRKYTEKEKTMVIISTIAGFLGGQEWVLILLAIILLFGGRKIPELMKGLGKGIREFKNSSKEISKEAKSEETKADEEK